MELSLRCFAAVPERGGLGEGEFLEDSDAVAVVEEGSAGGWLAVSGLREAHPETKVRMETTKTINRADLKGADSRRPSAAGSIDELCGRPNCCRGIATFTGGP